MPKKELVGKVVSNKMQKTVVVAVENDVQHRKYEKQTVRTSKFKAHDDDVDRQSHQHDGKEHGVYLRRDRLQEAVGPFPDQVKTDKKEHGRDGQREKRFVLFVAVGVFGIFRLAGQGDTLRFEVDGLVTRMRAD